MAHLGLYSVSTCMYRPQQERKRITVRIVANRAQSWHRIGASSKEPVKA